MKTRAIKFITTIFLSALVFACEKEVEFKGAGKDPVLVLNGVVENDSAFRVYLERSVFFLENNVSSENKYIQSGATVKVTNENTGQVYMMTTSYEFGRYEFPFITEPETNYKIEVEHPDYPTISSNTKTSKKIELLSVDTSSYFENGSTMKRAVLKWNDPSDENYYIIRVKSSYEDVETGTFYTESRWLLSSDISVDNSTTSSDLDGTVYYSDYLLVPDKIFNGQEKQLTIEFQAPYISETSPESPFTYQLIATNKETYMYFVSLKKHEKMDFLSEPVQVYSNIKNGFGIFGTFNYSEIIK